MVDAHDSKSCTARCEGSSPSFGTIYFLLVNMFNDNDRLIPEKVRKYLDEDEIQSFNALKKGSASMAEMRNLGMQLITSGMQRRTLKDIEERSDEARKKSEYMTKIATIAVGIQALAMIIDIIGKYCQWWQ